MINILKIFFSLFLIAIAIYILDLDLLISTLSNYSWLAFFLALMINILVQFFLGFRWYKLTSDQIKLDFKIHFHIYLKGMLYSFFTPSNLGGDVYRFLSYKDIDKVSLIFYLIKERLIGFYTYLLMFSLSYYFVFFIFLESTSESYYFNYALIFSILMFILLFCLIVFKVFQEHIFSIIKKIVGNRFEIFISKLKNYLREILTINNFPSVLLITIISFISVVYSFHIIGKGMNVELPLLQIAIVFSLVEIIRFLPITIQGIGLREAIFAFLLGTMSYNIESAYLIAAMTYLAVSLSIIICGGIGHLLPSKINRL